MAAMTDAELSGLLKANNRFNEDLRKYQRGLLPKDAVFSLGQPAGELSKHLNGSQAIVMQQHILTKAQKGHSTTVGLKQLEDLPIKLNQAPFIFQSKKAGSIVAVLSERDNENNPVVVPISKGRVILNIRSEVSVNLITSIHGRSQKQLDLWAENGLMLYGKEKTFTHSNLPDAIPGVGASKGFKDATNVAQNNESTNSLAEKMADLTKKNTALLRKSSNSNPHKSPGRGR